MSDRPSTSTQDVGDTASNTHPEMSSDEWFSMLRERASQSKPVYNLDNTPPSSPEPEEVQHVRKQHVKRSRKHSTETSQATESTSRHTETQEYQSIPVLHAETSEDDIIPAVRPSRKRPAAKPKPVQDKRIPVLRPTRDRPAERSASLSDRTDVFGNVETLSEKPYQIVRTYSRVIKKFNTSEEVFDVKFRMQYLGSNLVDMMNVMHEMFDDVLKMVASGRKPQDLVRVYINHPDIHKPVVVHLRPLHLLTSKVILDRLSHRLQSLESLKLDEALKIKVGVIEMPDDSNSGNV